jgi:acetylglutamate kinase
VTRIVKIGGRAQQAASLIATIAAAWRATPGHLAVVHGGGDEVTALQRAMGRTPQFIGGRRVTTDDDIAILRMTLSGVINKRLVSALVAAGLPAVGLSGEDAALLSAEPIDSATMGRAGEPAQVDPRVVRYLLEGGFLPIISPLARDVRSASGDALNVNGDDAAAAIAAALQASELLFVADVPGVLDGDRVLDVVDGQRMRSLIAAGTVTAGMIAKLEASQRALAAGVAQVRIGYLESIMNASTGTRIIASNAPHAFTSVLA